MHWHSVLPKRDYIVTLEKFAPFVSHRSASVLGAVPCHMLHPLPLAQWPAIRLATPWPFPWPLAWTSCLHFFVGASPFLHHVVPMPSCRMTMQHKCATQRLVLSLCSWSVLHDHDICVSMTWSMTCFAGYKNHSMQHWRHHVERYVVRHFIQWMWFLTFSQRNSRTNCNSWVQSFITPPPPPRVLTQAGFWFRGQKCGNMGLPRHAPCNTCCRHKPPLPLHDNKRVSSRPAYTPEHKSTWNYSHTITLPPILTLPAACTELQTTFSTRLELENRWFQKQPKRAETLGCRVWTSRAKNVCV